ncbi:azurin [Edaphocola flava]|jgi:azurin|uniref:azurin n=1 Tax=Edaphocola flava TaxID=2499629 RepID=UPI00100BA21C|nr:azurin [Edaphocola flava]
MKKIAITLTAISSFWLASCGGNQDAQNHDDHGTQSQEQAGSMVADDKPVTSIDLAAGDDMRFSQKDFTVPVGQQITLTLKHTGQSDKNIMGHNVVILKPGSSTSDFGNAAVNAKAEDYVPKELADKVIAHTQLIGGGEQTEIKFTITEPGDYPFLCSFPGHFGMMKGTITAK